MRKSVFVLFLLSLPIISRAQWLQTNLDPGAAYYLFSDDSGLYAGTETGVYFTSESGDPWFSIGPEDLIFSAYGMSIVCTIDLFRNRNCNIRR